MSDYNNSYNSGFVRPDKRSKKRFVISLMAAITVSAVATRELIKLLDEKRIYY